MRRFLRSHWPTTVLGAGWVLLFAAVLVFGGCTATTRERAWNASLAALEAARDGFLAWDARHQAELVDAAQSKAEGRESLDNYRTKRARLELGFSIALTAHAAAALDPTPKSVAEAIDEAHQVLELLRELGGKGTGTHGPP